MRHVIIPGLKLKNIVCQWCIIQTGLVYRGKYKADFSKEDAVFEEEALNGLLLICLI